MSRKSDLWSNHLTWRFFNLFICIVCIQLITCSQDHSKQIDALLPMASDLEKERVARQHVESERAALLAEYVGSVVQVSVTATAANLKHSAIQESLKQERVQVIM